MIVEILSLSISTKVRELAGIELPTLDLQSDSHLLPDMLTTELRGMVVIELKDGSQQTCMCGSRRGGPDPPLKNHKNIGFLSNSCPDSLKNYEATEPAFNVVPSWCFTGGPMMARL